MNLVKRHFFTTIEKQKKIRSVTKCNDAGFLVEIAVFSHVVASLTWRATTFLFHKQVIAAQMFGLLLLSAGHFVTEADRAFLTRTMGTLGSPVRVQARSRRLSVAATLLRARLRRGLCTKEPSLCKGGWPAKRDARVVAASGARFGGRPAR